MSYTEMDLIQESISVIEILYEYSKRKDVDYFCDNVRSGFHFCLLSDKFWDVGCEPHCYICRLCELTQEPVGYVLDKDYLQATVSYMRVKKELRRLRRRIYAKNK